MSERQRILFNVRWFLRHSDHWDAVSTELGSLRSTTAILAEPTDALDWPGLAPLASAYASTARTAAEHYARGVVVTADTADLLDDTARAYARAEAGNADLAGSILAELAGEF